MRKLLSAGFVRLWKNKIFWTGAVLISGVIIFAVIMNYRDMMSYDIVYTSDVFLTGCFVFIGCFTAAFASLFLGTEYSDGAIRNKLIAGHGRVSVYLSSLLLTAAASLLVCAISTFAAFAVGIPLLGQPVNPSLVLQKIGLGVLLVLSYSALFTFLAMLIHNKPLLSIASVLLFFLLLFAAIYIAFMLDTPEYITGAYTMTVNGEVVPQEPYPNPAYLRGIKRAVYEFLQDLLPTGQSLLIGYDTASSNPLRMSLCSLLLTLGFTFTGILAFRRKDLK
ncbi:MAG: ABC transporter permease [Roseburia sp.]|nr:ABC transporter permease [Roseburia sp.]MCM1097537.1 ABC transporter permease [Ruminococcus flavefaciens]